MDFSMFDNIRFESEKRPIARANNTEKNNMSRFPENTPLAMAYVPFQQWEQPYEIEEAFDAGTIFPELNLPFAPGGERL